MAPRLVCVCVRLSWMSGLRVGWLYLSSGLLLQAISGELVRRNPGLRALLIRLLRLLTQEYLFMCASTRFVVSCSFPARPPNGAWNLIDLLAASMPKIRSFKA